MMGRYGNLMMINNDESFILEVEQYQTKRFFVTNVANTRTFDFEISKNGKKENLKIVGGDLGRVEKEYMAENFIIAPAERYIFEARFDKEGEFLIKSRNKVLGKILVKKSNKTIKQEVFGKNLSKNLEDYKNIRDNFKKFLKQKADKKLRLTIAMKGMGMHGRATEMRRGQGHQDGNGEKMGGTLDDLMNKEKEMGGSPIVVDGNKIKWNEGMRMMNEMSNDQMME
jgi:FtsP/CotA-like multicopper oxidase with cupredoxin domain